MTTPIATIWDWGFAFSTIPTLARGFLVTLEAVLAGMAIALIGGLGLAVARRSHRRFLRVPVGAFVEFVRSTPLLIQLYFLYYVLMEELGLRLGPFATGAIGLGVYYAAYLSEVYRAGIEAVPAGQWEAAGALGLSRRHTYQFIILPQAIPPMLPVIGNYVIAMFKDTPLLSAITVVEILRQAQLIGKETFRYLEPLTLVGVFYLVASLASGLLVSRLEQRYRPRESGHGR